MNKILLITLYYFFLTSCQNVKDVENKKEKSLNKEFTISIKSNVKVN